MSYTEFLQQAKAQIKKIELGCVADEFDLLTEFKQIIIERQKTLREYRRRKQQLYVDGKLNKLK